MGSIHPVREGVDCEAKATEQCNGSYRRPEYAPGVYAPGALYARLGHGGGYNEPLDWG